MEEGKRESERGRAESGDEENSHTSLFSSLWNGWVTSARSARPLIAFFPPECDVSVSRLPGLETFANFLVVSVSVSENLGSDIKSRYRYRKIWSRKKSLGIGIDKFGLVRKVSVSVSENLVSEKKSRYRSQKIWSRKKFQRKNGQK